MRQSAVLGLALTTLMFAGLGPAMAQAGELILVDETAPPYMYDTPRGPAGVCPAIVREIFHRLGETVRIQAVPWKRLLAQLENGSAGVACARMTGERQELMDFSDSLLPVTFTILTRRGRITEYTGLDSLRGRTVGIRRGWSYGEAFDHVRASGAMRIEEASGDGQNFEKLLDGRIDAAILAEPSADMLLAAFDAGDRIVVFGDDTLTGEKRIAFPKSASKGALIGRINTELAAMRADGTLKLINGTVDRP